MQTPPEQTKNERIRDKVIKLVELIPNFGNSIAFVLDTIIPNTFEKRANKWKILLCEAITELERKVGKLDTKVGEQFTSLVIRATLSAYKTEHHEKHQALKNVLINSVVKANTYEDIFIIFIDLIDQLTVFHIQILKFIKENPDNINQKGTYDTLFDAFSGYSKNRLCERYEFIFFVNDLERKGLIYVSSSINESKGVKDSTLIAIDKINEDNFPIIRINEMGLSFLNFIVY